MSNVVYGDIKRASQGNAHLEQILLGLTQVQQSSQSQNKAVPPACQFVVQGVDGKFVVDITPPANQPPASINLRATRPSLTTTPVSVIYYELRSATDNTFDAAGGVTVYGPSSQVHWEIQDPNQTKFWQLRASYDGVNWNDWNSYTSLVVCGIVPVWSGFASTGSISNVNSAYTPSGGSPLAQHLTTTRIDVASSVCTFGSAPNVTYNVGSVDPGSFGTWYVYCLDLKRAGGAVTYIATATNPTITSDDSIVYFGKIVTSGGGGGTGQGGGGGPCCVAEVGVTMFPMAGMPAVMRNDKLRVGMILLGVDGGQEPILRIELSPNVPCFSYEAENGMVLQGCSSEHALQYDGGGFDASWLIISTHRVHTMNGPSPVKRKFLGHRTVYKLTLGGATKTYWADGFASHNALKG